MFDQDHGHPSVGYLPQELAQALDVLRSQAGGRFVEEEHLRLRSQSPSDLHDPLVDVGEPSSQTLQCAIIAHEGQEPLGKPHRLALSADIATHEQKRA